MDADDDLDLDRALAFYRSCCEQSGVEPLDDDEARALGSGHIPGLQVAPIHE